MSFAGKADISRPTLDRLLNGAVDNKSTFDRHLQKILKVLNMSVEELLLYRSVSAKPVTATVFSQNAPLEHERAKQRRNSITCFLILLICVKYIIKVAEQRSSGPLFSDGRSETEKSMYE